MRPDDPAVSATPIDLPASEPPTLFVVVDTEEEFDWSAPFSRQNTSVTAGTTYVYRLRAYGPNSLSSYSNADGAFAR